MPPGKPHTSKEWLYLGVAGWLLLALATLPLRAAGPVCPGPDRDPSETVLTKADEELLDEIQRTSFQFFLEQSHEVTGLVRDRARADGSPSEGKASIAASGFALSTWVIAVERGWVSREEALTKTRAKLRYIVERVPRPHGFFYHFMEMESGARAWQCELSSIDSSIFYAGAIVAREYFEDPEITMLVNQILSAVDWNWFLNGGELVSLSWHDETGFSRYRWNGYSEHYLMSFLALGVSAKPLAAAYWRLWQRYPLGRYGDWVYLQEPPLFVNQFPQAFLDVRDRRDAFADYFHNTRLATLAQRQFSLDLRNEFPAWSGTLWGLTASDSATGYKAWGGPPRTLRYNSLDGTVVPCAAAGSLPFAPRETLAVLHHMRNIYGDRIWKRYGFVDAFNPNNGWVNPDVLGIDLGISALQAENLRTGLIQRLFMQSPEAQLALAKAGLLSTSRELDREQQQQLLGRARQSWTLLQKQPAAAGLQLTALLAAQRLGFVTGEELITQARALLNSPFTATNANDIAQYAAGLITLRQAVPMLEKEATQKLEGVSWKSLPPTSTQLGNATRLAVFLQIAAGVRPPADWDTLQRTTETVGVVQALAPADVAGALLPGLWLDERSILSGASAAQLAYASLTGGEIPANPLLSALQLDFFPRETFGAPVPPPTTPESAAALLITTANLLVNDSVRHAFQADSLVQVGRKSIAEFGEAAFGPNTSVIAQRELSGAKPLAPQRTTVAVSNKTPREQWDWQRVEGLEFKDSNADIRPEDPPLSFRFATTWDEEALYFHAEVTDAPKGFILPPGRNRVVELYIDPALDGLIWTGPKDYQFTYRMGVGARELFNNAPNEGSFSDTAEGYTVESKIPWSSIGLTPHAGLEFGITAAVITEGTKEWEPTLKLNWSYVPLRAGVNRLGRVQLR